MDAWDMIVGIPIEDWMRATTVTELDWLLHLRDNPMPLPHYDEADGCEITKVYAWGGQLVRTVHCPAQ
jgi:hypothetical protein